MSGTFKASEHSSWTQPGADLFAEQAAMDDGRTAGPIGGTSQQRNHTLLVNDTDLPDSEVYPSMQQWATDVYFQEMASLAGAQSTFQTYVNDGSLLAKHRYRTPTNVIEEMKLARDLAERDDDIRAIIGGAIAVAFGTIHQFAKDQKTLDLFREIAKPKRMGLEMLCEELMRELYITSSFTTVHLFQPDMLQFNDDDSTGEFKAAPSKTAVRMLTPKVGVLPGENIRVVGSDLFGDQALAYWPGDDPRLTKFLEEYFDDRTSAARKREMQKIDPVSTTLFVAPIEVQEQQAFLMGTSFKAYLMNPRMVHRTTIAKGFWPYPRPLIASVFPMLEAKRLLNIMDFALLQGAANFVIVAKKGSDARPAQPVELTQLSNQVRHMGRTGVIIGDHRLEFDILTPKIEGLLDPEKRNLIGRKIAMALLRKPENVADEGSALAETEVEWVSRVIANDRQKILSHIHHFIYEDIVDANPTVLKEAAEIWCPPIILRGTQFFTDYVLKLRDRGDIPRKWAVEAAGFGFGAAVAERKREVDSGVDDIMIPAEVPYTVPGGVADKGAPTEADARGGAKPKQVNDNGGGRPNGAATGRTTIDPARRPKTISRNAGETIKAWREKDAKGEPTGDTYRMGENTRRILKLYDDVAEVGRCTTAEKDALTTVDISTSAGMTIIPLNPEYETADLKAVRLSGLALSMYVGTMRDGTIVAKGLGFRAPDYDPLTAMETAMEWGYVLEGDND